MLPRVLDATVRQFVLDFSLKLSMLSINPSEGLGEPQRLALLRVTGELAPWSASVTGSTESHFGGYPGY